MPFGEELLAGVGARSTNLKYSSNGIDNIRQRFTGYEKDIETELDFAEARMYKNDHGRFTSPDPLLASASLGNPQTFNRYAYTGNNPISFTDPSGLIWCRESGGGTYWTGKQACKNSSDTIVDGQSLELAGGSIKTVGGYVATKGDVVTFNANGTATLVSVSQQRATVNETVEVSSSVEEEIDPGESVGTNPLSVIQQKPIDILPLCLTGQTCSPPSASLPPPLVEGASFEDVLNVSQITLDIIGGTEIPIISQGAEITNIGIDFLRGDNTSVLLGIASLAPGAGAAGTAGKIARRLNKVSREQRWVQLANMSNSRLPKEVIDHNNRKNGKDVFKRFGLELAHPPKRANAQGFDYSEAIPKTAADHRGIQHRYLRERKTGTTIRIPRSGTRGNGRLSLPRRGRLPR